MTRNISEGSYAKTLSSVAYRVRQLERRPCAPCGAAQGLEMYRRVSDASTNAVVITPCPGTFYGHQLGNDNDLNFRYVHLYDKASPPTGSDTPKITLSIPWDSGANQEYPDGIEFDVGIAMAFSTSATTLAAVAANEIVANIAYIPDDCPPVEAESSSAASSQPTQTAVQAARMTRRRQDSTMSELRPPAA